MLNIGILDFLMSKAHNISVLNCSSNFEYTDDLFEMILTGKYCDSDIDLGIVYVKRLSDYHYLLVDGKRRLLSFILMIKAIADYYADLAKEDAFLQHPVQADCLKVLSMLKIRLFGLEKTVFDKLINNEPISYNEKQTEIYRTLNLFRENIKYLDFDVEQFYELLLRLKVNVVFLNDSSEKDIFCVLNKNLRPLNQLLLIKSYLAELNCAEFVNELYFLFGYKEEIFVSFFKAYLSPKFNRIITDNNLVYDYFVKYIDMVRKFQDFKAILASITKTAKIYKKMYNADFMDSEMRNMFIKIISNDGRDTFSYLLELCEDYENKYLSKETFLEVCNIVYTYIWERTKKSSHVNENIDFSKMVHELNKVIYDEHASNEGNKENQG